MENKTKILSYRIYYQDPIYAITCNKMRNGDITLEGHECLTIE